MIEYEGETHRHSSSSPGRHMVRDMTDQKIAVYGASGYTGRLVVAEPARRDIPRVLVGRGFQRLRAAADGAGGPDAELRLAPLDDPAALADAVRDNAAVINAAGTPPPPRQPAR